MPNNLSIKISSTSPENHRAWDEFVLSHPDSGPYHRWGWGAAINQAYAHKQYYLIAIDDLSGKIQGILPLILMKIPFLKQKLVSLPFCDYAGPLTRYLPVEEKLITKAFDLAKELDASLDLRLSTPLTHLQSLNHHGQKQRLVLNLPSDAQTLFASFKTKRRTRIRRSQKTGCRVQFGGRELLVPFYRVFSRNMHDLGSPVHSFLWFDRLFAASGNDIRIGVVYMNKKPISVGILLQHRNTVTIPWSSTLREYNRIAPNMLLYWNFLAYAADNGYTSFDFGRSDPDSGTYRFKTQWEAQPQELYWYTPSIQTDTDPSKSRIREYAATTWSKLPAPAADWLGPRLRKYISL